MTTFQTQHQQLHFLLVPLMSQSHLIPFTDMAKLLAQHGMLITIVTTPLNAMRFKTFLSQARNSNLQIQFLPLPFPCQDAGLPQGCENMDSLPSPDLAWRFFKASNMLQEPLEKWLRELLCGIGDHKSLCLPNCIVADYCLPWTEDIARKFNIPRVMFHVISCFTQVCTHHIARCKLDSDHDSDKPFLVPGLPDRIEFTKEQLPGKVMKQSSELDREDILAKFKSAQLSAQGMVINTFEELEQSYVKQYEKIVKKKVWCIGPVSLSKRLDSSDHDQELICSKWLDSKKAGSVIYTCFGSLCRLGALQLKELALGLEASNRPFIWVIKKKDYTRGFQKWLVEENNFEERVGKERCLIILGWAPQVLILNHPAIGGFFTHCGWNSTLEGVSSGVPMITWPMFAEQFYNEKLIVQVLKIGVRVGVEKLGTQYWGDQEDQDLDDKRLVLVKREDIKKAIEDLMEGEERLRRAKKLGEMANRALEEGGSSYLNILLLIQHVKEQMINPNSTTLN